MPRPPSPAAPRAAARIDVEAARVAELGRACAADELANVDARFRERAAQLDSTEALQARGRRLAQAFAYVSALPRLRCSSRRLSQTSRPSTAWQRLRARNWPPSAQRWGPRPR